MKNDIEVRTFDFALRTVRLFKYLQSDKKEFILSKQVLRSGTSIGANVCESQQAQSKADFISKMSIALKEAVETEYWLRLLVSSDYLAENEFNSLRKDLKEIIKILTSIIKTSKSNIDRDKNK